MSWLSHAAIDAGDHHVNDHGDKGGEDRSESVLSTTILGDTHDLSDGPADEIHPGHGGGEGEATNDGVESLGLKLLADDIDGLEGSGNGGHCIYTTLGKLFR